MSQQQYTAHTKKPILAITFFFMSIQALNYSIENKTDGQIQILIEYEGSSICTPTERLIEKNKSTTIKAGPCQVRKIIIQGSGVLHTIPKPSSAAIQNYTITIMDKKPKSKTCSDESKFFITISYQQ